MLNLSPNKNGGFSVNRLFIFASILSMLGCNHKDKEQVESVKKEPVSHQIQKVDQKEYNYAVHLPQKPTAMLNVSVINQNPELKFGCEVTSLAMVLNHAGVKTNKMELYRAVQKESDPLVRTPGGDILRWGNPEYGFVGDMTGRRAGTTVFDKPLITLINEKLPGRAINLTNQPFERVLDHVSKGYPVVVWTTLDYSLPRRWETWGHGNQIVRVPLDLHAVVLVGFDQNFVYINDPLTVKKQVRINKSRFISSWRALGSRAVSYN
jgi:uncharacterized protein YvpB